jgi:hypothetical protein
MAPGDAQGRAQQAPAEAEASIDRGWLDSVRALPIERRPVRVCGKVGARKKKERKEKSSM